MADENDETEGYGLVMPFVVCASAGGPYDDDAFVAGVRLGADMTELKVLLTVEQPYEWRRMVATPIVPQYDLLAMHHGFVMTSEPWEDAPDQWTLVVFTRPEVADA